MSSTKITLLLINANEELVELLRTILEDRYELFPAKNEHTGLVKARKSIPDIILINCQKKPENYRELCYSLQQNWLTSHIPIILLISKGDNVNAYQGYKANAYLQFPFQPKALFLCMQRIVRLKIRLQQRFTMFYSEDNLFTREDRFLSNYINNLSE